MEKHRCRFCERIFGEVDRHSVSYVQRKAHMNRLSDDYRALGVYSRVTPGARQMVVATEWNVLCLTHETCRLKTRIASRN
jgi:hypothetical protein